MRRRRKTRRSRFWRADQIRIASFMGQDAGRIDLTFPIRTRFDVRIRNLDARNRVFLHARPMIDVVRCFLGGDPAGSSPRIVATEGDSPSPSMAALGECAW